jgi:hypothetical protein
MFSTTINFFKGKISLAPKKNTQKFKILFVRFWDLLVYFDFKKTFIPNFRFGSHYGNNIDDAINNDRFFCVKFDGMGFK